MPIPVHRASQSPPTTIGDDHHWWNGQLRQPDVHAQNRIINVN